MSANDFYFKSATFDYYLDKEKDLGSSVLRTEEVLTAVFPDQDQNHGIERCLPKKYRGVSSLVESSFSVKRNGADEPFSTYNDGDSTCFRIGSASSYVHGENIYKISYNSKNVILAPDNSKNQELYWDTNGTGWAQSFNSLTATVHLPAYLASNFLGNPSCYVGIYGTAGSLATSRCETFVSSDNTEISFHSESLGPYENLTLDLEFSPNTFYVKKDLTPFIILGVVTLGALALIIASIRAHLKAHARNAEKISLSKSPKPVQYIPPKNLSVAEAATVWLKQPAGELKIATLLDLAVNHRIELEKAEKTSKILKRKSTLWKIHAKDLSGLRSEEQNVLDILNGGAAVKTGDIIDVETQSYSSKVAKLSTDYLENIKLALESKGLFALKENRKFLLLAPTYNKYEKRTKQGIETSNYLDGLKEYIKLAETDRINFLHSVPNLDVSNAGIAKLYEKLLPYAIIFGCETTWLKELNKYYEMPDVENPDWLMTGYLLSSSDFRSFHIATSSSISSATVSSSSGSSGGGGGGFSGGGGGGGGGGGW
ncbi:DUF2207 domain-containing protein [Candidatus Saccharibacteria bacterium]|nr:DUF2207 domain-containing protein [Candidatus Saccharibacteria bacterium]